MPNKLKDVFSNKMFELGGSLHFRDVGAQNAFFDALKIVQEEGRMVELNGVSSISTNVKDGNLLYPFMVEQEVDRVVIGPAIDKLPITFNTGCGERTVNFKRYETNSTVFLETDESDTAFFKVAFNKSTHKVTFSYRMQSQFAKTTKGVADGYCTILGMLDHFFKSDNKQPITKEIETLQDIKKSLQLTYSFWNKLSLVEDELNLVLDPKQIGNIDENVRDVEELFLLLVKRQVVRLDGEYSSLETTEIALKPEAKIPDIGQAIILTFTSKITYSICGHNIEIHTANLLSNAIVKEIQETESEGIKILYSGTDSTPMYFSFTGFKAYEEAEEELKLIMRNKELMDKYIRANTIDEYLRTTM